MTGCIVGWAHTKFGKHEGVELETLVVDAATEHGRWSADSS